MKIKIVKKKKSLKERKKETKKNIWM